MIKKILVALDGSEPAENALKFALEIADKFSANILLLSVIPQIQIPIPTTTGLTEKQIHVEILNNYSEEIKTTHSKLLSESLKKAKAIKPNLKISTKLIEGRPSDTIIKVAEEENFDLIIMGSRGLSGIKKLFLGSVSNGVINECTCPVLIVK